MTFWRLREVSIFWQTLFLLFIFLVVVQKVTSTLLLASLQSSPSFIGMNEIAQRLVRDPQGDLPEPASASAAAKVTPASGPPSSPRGMTQSRKLTLELAGKLRVAPAKVRLFYAPDQRRFSPFIGPARSEPIPHFRGEALFFDKVTAAAEIEGRWRVLSMPRSPRIVEWQNRQSLNEVMIILVLIATAFLFARQLSRPMRRFADSADRLGRDTSAPPVPVKGPYELRTTARAINAMQRRIEEILRERTEMVAAIAHDLRTPLARIAFRVEGASDAIREPVLEDIEQMRELIATTLDFSRTMSNTQRREACDLGALVEEIARGALEVGQDVKVLAAPSLRVAGDRLALKRMLQNLVENAAKYADGGSMAVARRHDLAIVEVSDRGPGLPEEMLERVLNPFVRNEPSRNRETGGVGLGLAIARSIAAMHGGSLILVNRSGGGLTARVSLPLIVENA